MGKLTHYYIILSCMDVYCTFVEVFVLISYVGGPGNLLCSHETLHLSLLHPTVYTQISGNKYHELYNNYRYVATYISYYAFMHMYACIYC